MRRLVKALVWAIAGCALAACGNAAPAPSAPPSATSSAAAKPSAASVAPKPAGSSAAPKPAGSASAAASGRLMSVRWGELTPSVSDSGMLIATAKGWFEEQGLKIEAQHFDTAINMIAPLGTNRLEAGGGAIGASLFNAVNRDIPIMITADKGSALPGGGYQGLVVRKDLVASGKFKSTADLQGMKVAVAAPGGVGEYDVERLLKTANLSIKDIQLVQLAYPNMAAALTNKSIDAADVVEPFLTDFVHKDLVALYQRSGQWAPDEQIAAILFSPEFAKNNAAANRFMTAYVKGVRFYNDAFVKKDPRARGEVIDILASRTSLKDKALFDEVGMPGLNPDGTVNLRDLKAQQDYYLSTGAQKKSVDLDRVVNRDFAAAAVQQLGPYK